MFCSDVVPESHVLKLGSKVASSKKRLLPLLVVLFHERVFNSEVLIRRRAIHVLKLRRSELGSSRHGFEALLPLLQLPLDGISRGLPLCALVRLVIPRIVVRQEPIGLAEAKVSPGLLLSARQLGLLSPVVLGEVISVKVELVLGSVSLGNDQVIAHSLDHAVLALDLTPHHPVVEVPRLLQVPRVVVGQAKCIAGLNLIALVPLLPGKFEHLVEVLDGHQLVVLEAVNVAQLAIADYLLFEPALALAEALKLLVALHGSLEVLELQVYIPLDLHRVELQLEVLIGSKKCLVEWDLLTLGPCSEHLRLLCLGLLQEMHSVLARLLPVVLALPLRLEEG